MTNATREQRHAAEARKDFEKSKSKTVVHPGVKILQKRIREVAEKRRRLERFSQDGGPEKMRAEIEQNRKDLLGRIRMLDTQLQNWDETVANAAAEAAAFDVKLTKLRDACTQAEQNDLIADAIVVKAKMAREK